MGYKVVLCSAHAQFEARVLSRSMHQTSFLVFFSDDEKIEHLDCADTDVIVFDEIIFHNVGKWSLVWDFCLNNPDKIVVVTGDTKQLKILKAKVMSLALRSRLV